VTVSLLTTKHVYAGDGVTINWPYTFPITAASDIKVYKTAADGTVTLITTLYTVDTTNSYVVYPNTGSPLISTEKVTLIRDVPLTQLVDYKNNGAFNAETLETALDKSTLQAQQIDEALDRCVKYPIDQNPTDATTTTFLSSITASQTAAAASASAASSSASAASSSATAAAGSATTASTQAGTATTQAGNAATSASTATTQASNAAASAVTATNEAATATAQAATATTQASNASVSATTATTQATTATTQAGIATTQATTATTQATNASNSATAAGNSATAALASETAAAAWAASVVNPLATTGGTMTGPIAMSSNKVTGLAAATANGDALRYEQALRLVGGTMSGAIAMGGNEITGLVDSALTPAAPGSTATGLLNRISQIVKRFIDAFGITNWYDTLPSGRVIQSVTAVHSADVSTTSATYIDTNLSCTITPRLASSIIRVTYFHQCAQSAANTVMGIRILRTSTVIKTNARAFGTAGAIGNAGNVVQSHDDAPATTSPVTYKTQFQNSDATGTVYIYEATGGPGLMKLEEIAA